MIVTDKFVYLHLPKTGGTFVRSVLRKISRQAGGFFLDGDSLPKHGAVKNIPPQYRDRPILSTIRNPYDHLVSVFEFEWWKTHPTDTFDFDKMIQRYPEYPNIDFATYIRSIYDWQLLDTSYAPTSVKQAFEKADLGLLTYDYIRFFSSDPEEELNNVDDFDVLRMTKIMENIILIRTDTLNEDFYDFLKIMDFTVSDIEFIKSARKIVLPGGNRNRERHWTEYYCKELKSIVRQKERLLFGVFPEFDV